MKNIILLLSFTFLLLPAIESIKAQENPMGRTWLIFIENSEYESFPQLDGPKKDVTILKEALAKYEINNFIHIKNKTQSELTALFHTQLPELLDKNEVKSFLIWYAGHGENVNNVGYWIPVDAKQGDEFSYFNINSFRAAANKYTDLTHILLINDASFVGPSIYSASRSAPKRRTCDDLEEAASLASAQILASAGNENVADNSLFTRFFTNALNSNKNSCIPIEEVVSSLVLEMNKNSQQRPKFGKIAGLKDEGGTFFFVKK